MNIRSRLTLLFLVINFIILLLSFLAIELTQAGFRKEQYTERLKIKANLIENRFVETGKFIVEDFKTVQKGSASLVDEQISIFDQENRVIFQYPEKSFIKINPKSALFNNKISKDELIKIESHECYISHFKMKNKDYSVVVAAVDIYGLSKLGYLKNVLFALFLMGLIVSTLAGWFFSGRALSPITDIINQVDKLTIGDLSKRLGNTRNNDELGRLTITFNKLLNRIESAFKVQKTFIANASHELRTPLTLISGQLELALMKERTTNDYKETITNVLEDIKNLNQINSSLLLLAQSNNQISEESKCPIRIDELIWLVRSDFIRLKQEAKIEVIFQNSPEDESQLITNANDYLLKISFKNIIDNACKFSQDQKVRLLIDFSPSMIIVEFKDNGVGISEHDLPHIFNPLFRGNNSQGKSGYGLGLPITDNIIRLHGGFIEVQSRLNEGSVFRVHLPRLHVAG